MDILTIVLVAIFIIIMLVLSRYNKIIKLENAVKQSKSGIDIYLNQRFDLIPNLVECVKAYSKHEKETLEKIVELRNSYNAGNKNSLKDAEKLNNGINQIMLVGENYPELKANEQYLNLQKNLVKIESQLQAARRIYNNDVASYNTKIQTIPSNIVAILFGFKEKELFQIEEYKKENIVIKDM